MLSQEQIKRYREMTPGERFAIFIELMDIAWQALEALPEDEKRHRLDVIERVHRLSTQRISRRFLELMREEQRNT